jgi:hypothetical protein
MRWSALGKLSLNSFLSGSTYNKSNCVNQTLPNYGLGGITRMKRELLESGIPIVSVEIGTLLKVFR